MNVENAVVLKLFPGIRNYISKNSFRWGGTSFLRLIPSGLLSFRSLWLNTSLIGLLLFGWQSAVNAQVVSSSVFGINPVTKVRCENKATGQKITLSYPGGSTFNCIDLGLNTNPGDVVKQTIEGNAIDPANIGGSVTGVTAIKNIRCQNKSTHKAVSIKPLTVDWNCSAKGLVIHTGDRIKQSVEGLVAQTTPTLPATPTGLVATAGDGVVTLDWQPAAQADYYHIYGSTDLGVINLLTETVAPLYTDTGLSNGTIYYYFVTALNALGESAPSIIVAATPGMTLFDHSTVIGQTCISCHDGVNASGKSPTHINTTDLCETCHTTEAWLPVFLPDHSEVLGTCASCHNGVIASGKSSAHILSTDVCDACHMPGPSPWTPVVPSAVDHTQVIGTCESCHNGVIAIGKGALHIPTVEACEVCHNTSSWLTPGGGPVPPPPPTPLPPPTPPLPPPTIPPPVFDHSTVVGLPCIACHDGVFASGKSANHPLTTDFCEACHTPTIWTLINLPFDHSQVFGSCESCHNNVIATGKSANHIATQAPCELCHVYDNWLVIIAGPVPPLPPPPPPNPPLPAPVDHSIITGACVSCHNGVDASGKSPAHITSTDMCDACHAIPPALWIPVAAYAVDHTQVLGTCESCHNGIVATGKSATHVVTTLGCDICHNTDLWIAPLPLPIP